jgi:hypothetical protein
MNWENLLTQLPIVAVFVWFVLEMDRRNAIYSARRDEQWREFLHQQATAAETTLERIAAMLDRVSQRLDAHDTAMRQAVARMQGQTKAARKK